MKVILFVVGIVIGLPGLVFFLQGLKVVPAGGMYGSGTWVAIGAVMVVVGVLAIVASFRLGTRKAPSDH